MTISHPPEDHPYHVQAAPGLLDVGTRVLKQGDTFLVCEAHGDVIARSGGQLGLYHHGTRYMSHLALRLYGRRMLLLGSTVRADNILMTVELMNPGTKNPGTNNGDGLLEHGALHARRERLLWGGAWKERIEVTSFATAAVEVPMVVELAADFVDLFEVRGTPRARRGTLHEPELEGSEVRLGYTGLDGVERCTRIVFDPAPAALSRDRALFELALGPRGSATLAFTITCTALPVAPGSAARAGGAPAPGDAAQHHAPHQSFERAMHAAQAQRAAQVREECAIETSNELFDAWLHRSQADLRMMVTHTPEGRYPYAGVPWFSAPFGRDGIITALQWMWVDPSLAAGVLEFLAAHQADAVDDAADAEPGKILHEMRPGEMAALGEVPFARYYGTVDATPLFLLLAGRYYRATGDLQRVQRLWPNVLRALDWIDHYGDRDGDGFVEYGSRASHGLEQQGWKDSHDSVFHADGAPARGPIALCEVQAYVYAARLAVAELAAALGDAALAQEQRARAAALRDAFEDAYWCEELSCYALALDGDKRPCRVRSSNAGHCLFAGIARPERAARLGEQLVGPEMFSGWGVRTLATTELRYNPMAYHNGSIWPHDNALIAEGLATYGLMHQALRILDGMFAVSHEVELHRLPELFCGFGRRADEAPILYPVACAPQSWAAASVFMLLGAALGLSVDATERQVVLRRPALPPWLDMVRLRNLQVGDERVELTLRRYPEDVAVTVDRRTGPVSILTRK